MRLVVVTFALLGFAWYELSGGAEFQPGDVSLTLFAEPTYTGPVLFAGLLDRPVEGARQSRVRQASVDVAETRASAIERAVAKVPGATLVRASADASDPQPVRIGGAFANGSGNAFDNGSGGAFTDRSGAIFDTGAGLEAVDASAQATGTVLSPDIRHVADTRVPLLDRPSEGAEMLVELLRGEPVAVLRDGATGWVQLRALDGGTVGWAEARHLEPSQDATLASAGETTLASN